MMSFNYKSKYVFKNLEGAESMIDATLHEARWAIQERDQKIKQLEGGEREIEHYPSWLPDFAFSTEWGLGRWRCVYDILGDISFIIGINRQRMENIAYMASTYNITPEEVAENLVTYIRATS